MNGDSTPTPGNEGNALIIDLNLSTGVVAMAPISAEQSVLNSQL